MANRGDGSSCIKYSIIFDNINKSRLHDGLLAVGTQTPVNMKGVSFLAGLTLLSYLAEAQLECNVQGECAGQLVGFVDDDDPVM